MHTDSYNRDIPIKFTLSIFDTYFIMVKMNSKKTSNTLIKPMKSVAQYELLIEIYMYSHAFGVLLQRQPGRRTSRRGKGATTHTHRRGTERNTENRQSGTRMVNTVGNKG